MNEIDKRIIEVLRENSRESYVGIAKRIGLSEGTIRSRIKDMLERGIIKKFTVITQEPEHLNVFVEISTDPETRTSGIGDEVRKLRGVTEVYELAGEVDILARISAGSNLLVDDVIEKIRSIKGVRNTSTHLILKQYGGETYV